MESTFGAHAMGGDPVERFDVGFGEKRVDSICGQTGFEAICTFDIPGGEEDLCIESAFDWAGGMELESEGDGESLEGLVVLFGEEHGLLSVEISVGGEH